MCIVRNRCWRSPTVGPRPPRVLISVVVTSLSGLAAHSRDSSGDLDMMVALVCMTGFKDQTCGDKGGKGARGAL